MTVPTFATACVGLPTAASAFEIASRRAGQLPCIGRPGWEAATLHVAGATEQSPTSMSVVEHS